MHRANLNNQPELPELRHRRMPQALTTIMQSGSMRAGGRDSRSDMKDGTGSPVAMPACTAPLRVKWLHLAAALVGIAATMVPGVGIADDVYLRAGIGFDRPAETRFMDKDCSSVSPAALYGCGIHYESWPISRQALPGFERQDFQSPAQSRSNVQYNSDLILLLRQ